MATEVDDNYVKEEGDCYVKEDEYVEDDYEEYVEEDEYGFLSYVFATEGDEDDMETSKYFELLKVPAEDYKDLSPEQRVHWMTAHFLIQRNEPPKGPLPKKEQVSKVAEDGDIEEESKTSDDDGGSGPRGASWKSSSKPGGV